MRNKSGVRFEKHEMRPTSRVSRASPGRRHWRRVSREVTCTSRIREYGLQMWAQVLLSYNGKCRRHAVCIDSLHITMRFMFSVYESGMS